MKREPRWTRQEKQWLSGLIKACVPPARIATKLGRSENAVRAMTAKLGFYVTEIGARDEYEIEMGSPIPSDSRAHC